MDRPAISQEQLGGKAKNKAIASLINAWRTQLQRENERFHIPSKTMRKIVSDAIRLGRSAIRFDENLIDKVIDECCEISIRCYRRNKNCPDGCRCGDGYHISMAMNSNRDKIKKKHL